MGVKKIISIVCFILVLVTGIHLARQRQIERDRAAGWNWFISGVSVYQPEDRPRDEMAVLFNLDEVKESLNRQAAVYPRFKERTSFWRKRKVANSFKLLLQMDSSAIKPSEIVSNGMECLVTVKGYLEVESGEPISGKESRSSSGSDVQRIAAVGHGASACNESLEGIGAKDESMRKAFAKPLDRAFADLMHNFSNRLTVREQDLETLVGNLYSTRDGLILDTLDELGERDLPNQGAEAQSLRQGLGHILAENDLEEILMRTVGLMKLMGDREFVPTLIGAAESLDGSESDEASMYLTILSAISGIGGPQAEGYLFTLSTGHTSAAVREVSSVYLKELEKRNAEGENGDNATGGGTEKGPGSSGK